MLLLMCLTLGILFTMSKCDSYEASKCPTWMYLSSRNNSSCKCGSSLRGAVYCNSRTSTVYLHKLFCIFFNEELNITLIGTCPYAIRGETLPKSTCKHVHRRGQLCGACEENHTLPVYSYYLGCVKCEHFKYRWIKFITATFLPLTVFYIIMILFRISATSSALTASHLHHIYLCQTP